MSLEHALSNLEQQALYHLRHEPTSKSIWNIFPIIRDYRASKAIIRRLQGVIPKDLGAGDERDELIIQNLMGFLQNEGVLVSYNPSLQVDGRYTPLKGIEISPNVRGRRKTHTLVHETAHRLHFHWGNALTTEFSEPHRWEVEAEASTYLGLSQVGIDTGAMSFPYVANHLLHCEDLGGSDRLKQLQQSRERILSVGYRIHNVISQQG